MLYRITLAATLLLSTLFFTTSAFAGVTTNKRTIYFEQGTIGTPQKEYVILDNEGDELVLIEEVQIVGPDADNFTTTYTGGLPRFIYPGQTPWLPVTFTPSSNEAQNATLQLVVNNGQLINIGLNGNVQGSIVANKTTLDFGTLEEGESKTLSTILSNISRDLKIITAVEITGEGAENFSTNYSEKLPRFIFPGQEPWVNVSFTCDNSATISTLLRLSVNDGSLVQVTLNGICQGAPDGNEVSWDNAINTIELISGTSKLVDLRLQSSLPLDNISANLEGDLAPILRLVNIIPTDDNSGYILTISVNAFKELGAGEFNGIINITGNAASTTASLELTVNIREANALDIPTETASPTPDNITKKIGGTEYISNQLLVMFEFEEENSDNIIRNIAQQYDAKIVGASLLLKTFQLEFEGLTDEQLEELKAEISEFQGVSRVTRAHVNDMVIKEPNDNNSDWSINSTNYGELRSGLSDFDSSNRGIDYFGDVRRQGSNLNDDIFNHHHLLINSTAAWNIETGSSATKILIADGGMDTNHPDFDNPEFYPASNSRTPGNRDHGTHVAGTTCAQGDDAIGVTGVMWDCDLYAVALALGDNSTANFQNFNIRPELDFPELSLNSAEAFFAASGISGAEISNHSWGKLNSTQEDALDNAGTMAQAIDFIRGRGLDPLLVIAAGNSGIELPNGDFDFDAFIGPIPTINFTSSDWDGDGLDNTNDNCPQISNPSQSNQDFDEFGDVCDGDMPTILDTLADIDQDLISDSLDNCPWVANDNTDSDSDGIGDACDEFNFIRPVDASRFSPAVLSISDPKYSASVITVGNTMLDGVRNTSSNLGPAVDVAAPGYVFNTAASATLSDTNLSTFYRWTGAGWVANSTDVSGYRWKNGTSMAAPQITGVAGLLRSRFPRNEFPEMTASEIKNCIIDAANKYGQPTRNSQIMQIALNDNTNLGFNVIDAPSAVLCAADQDLRSDSLVADKSTIILPKPFFGNNPTKLITITNTTDKPIEIENVVIAGYQHTHFKILPPIDNTLLSATNNIRVQANDSIQIEVAYDPLNTESHKAHLLLALDDKKVLEVELKGITDENPLSVNRDSISFGPTPVDTSKSISIELENLSFIDSASISVDVIGGSDQFSVTTSTLEISPQETKELEFTYRPRSETSANAIAKLTLSSGEEIEITLTGEGRENSGNILSGTLGTCGNTSSPPALIRFPESFTQQDGVILEINVDATFNGVGPSAGLSGRTGGQILDIAQNRVREGIIERIATDGTTVWEIDLSIERTFPITYIAFEQDCRTVQYSVSWAFINDHSEVLTLSTDTLNYESVGVGAGKQMILEYTNNTNTEFSINRLDLTGDSSQFTPVIFPSNPLNISMPPGTTKDVRIIFEPTDEVSYNAIGKFTLSTGDQIEFLLSGQGQGIGNPISFPSTEIDFGETTIGSPTERTFFLNNNRSIDIPYEMEIIGGDGQLSFFFGQTITSQSGSISRPGGTDQQFSIVYKPRFTEPLDAKVLLTSPNGELSEMRISGWGSVSDNCPTILSNGIESETIHLGDILLGSIEQFTISVSPSSSSSQTTPVQLRITESLDLDDQFDLDNQVFEVIAGGNDALINGAFSATQPGQSNAVYTLFSSVCERGLKFTANVIN